MSAAIVLLQQRMPDPPRQHGLHILPRVFATASLANASEAVHQHKAPHALRLVVANEDNAPRETAHFPTATRDLEPEIAFYRKYTEGLLRRYATLSMEKGRVPSLLGRELFRGKVSSYKVQAFDDVVIFVHDMERCLAVLDAGSRHLVRRVAIEGYTQQETAALVGICLRTVVSRYAEAVDKLTRVLLERRLLEPLTSASQPN